MPNEIIKVKCLAWCLAWSKLLLLWSECLIQTMLLLSKHCITGALLSANHLLLTCSEHTVCVSSSHLPDSSHFANSWSSEFSKWFVSSQTLNHDTIWSLYMSNGKGQLSDFNFLKLKAGSDSVNKGSRWQNDQVLAWATLYLRNSKKLASLSVWPRAASLLNWE